MKDDCVKCKASGACCVHGCDAERIVSDKLAALCVVLAKIRACKKRQKWDAKAKGGTR